MKKISIAYFGTPTFSAHILKRVLKELSELVEVKYVVTQPDMPIGRRQILTPSSVKTIALNHNIPVFHDIELEKLASLDLVLLFAYGKIITTSQLSAPKHGFWNIHLSLLPQFRGATPTVFPLILGHKNTGTTLTKMDSELDHGPIIAQYERAIESDTTNTELINLLANDSFEILKQVLSSNNDLADVQMHPQKHENATYTHTLARSDGFIELDFIKAALKNEPSSTVPAILLNYMHSTDNAGETLFNMWRGLTPWPGIWTILKNNKRLKLLECELKDGIFAIKTVQIEGKNPAPFVASTLETIS